MNFKHFERIDSTQKEAWRLYENTKENDVVIVADTQDAGIGTHGRSWVTGEGNIAFSFLFRVNADIGAFEGLTHKIAEIIVDIFKRDYDLNIDIKLPNDLMINNQKVGGILVETKLLKNEVKAIVIGIGINIKSAPKDSDVNAIAINEVYKIDIDKEKIINKICSSIKEEILERIN